MDSRSKQARRRVACAVIAGTAALALSLSVRHEVQVIEGLTTPRTMSTQTTNTQEEECLYRAIRSQVPQGAHVYVNSKDWHSMQRLAELSTLWAVPEANLANARYKLVVVPARGHCDGHALQVSRT